MLGPGRVRGDRAALELDVAPDLAASLNGALVAAGVAVHELRWHEPDLERVFFELTGGGPRCGLT